MRVYIAGGSDERLTIVRPMIDYVTSLGIQVSHDWTRCPRYDRELTLAETTQEVGKDLEGVRSADVVWIMAPDQKSEGSAAELGAALALQKTVFVSGRFASIPSRVFVLLASRIFSTHAAALREVIRRHEAC